MNNKIVYIVAGAALLLGSVGSIAVQAYAQNSSTTTNPNTTPVVQSQNTTQSQAAINDPKDLQGPDTDNIQDNNQSDDPKDLAGPDSDNINAQNDSHKGHEDGINDGETNDDGGSSSSSTSSN